MRDRQKYLAYMREYNKKYRILNAKKRAFLNEQWANKNPEKFKAMLKRAQEKFLAKNPGYMKEAQKKFRLENPKKIRMYQVKHNYNLTVQQYTFLLKVQNNRCYICLALFNKKVIPHVDHDRSCCSGKTSCGRCIRGILCRNCNLGIGHLQENFKIVENAMKYLKRRGYDQNTKREHKKRKSKK